MNKVQINNRIRQGQTFSKIIRIIRFIAGTVAGIAAFLIYGTVGAIEKDLYIEIANRNLLIFGCIFAVSFFVWYECGGKNEFEE